MITWLVGENSFEIREALSGIEADFGGTPEKVDAASLSLAQLPDILMGVSLFADKRLVVIHDITSNSHLWEKLPDWLPRINDDIHVVFVDTKPDKRTTSYKALKAVADLHEFPIWGDRDQAKAQQWVSARAQQKGVTLDSRSAQHLVQRVGLDQWQLAQALDILSLLDEITPQAIDNSIPAQPAENIFQLFETALDGRPAQAAEMVRTLELQQDPYAMFALLSSQALALAAVTFAAEGDAPAKDFAIHPFVASKMARHAKKLGKQKVTHLLSLFAQTDADMKRSKAEPWILIEQLLLKVASS